MNAPLITAKAAAPEQLLKDRIDQAKIDREIWPDVPGEAKIVKPASECMPVRIDTGGIVPGKLGLMRFNGAFLTHKEHI